MTIFSPVPDRIVVERLPDPLEREPVRDDAGQFVLSAIEVVHRDPVLAVGGAVRTGDDELLVVELVHVQRAHRVVLGEPGEVHDAAALGRHRQRGLLRRLGRRRHADPLGAVPAGPGQHGLDAVVLVGHPRVVDRVPDRVHGDLQPVRGDVGEEHAARAAVACHDRLPAPDRSRAEDHAPCRPGGCRAARSRSARTRTDRRRSPGPTAGHAGSGIRFFTAIGGTEARSAYAPGYGS